MYRRFWMSTGSTTCRWWRPSVTTPDLNMFYCGIILIGVDQCSWIFKTCRDVFSWVTVCLHYNVRQFNILLNVCGDVNSMVRVTHKISECWSPPEQWWFHSAPLHLFVYLPWILTCFTTVCNYELHIHIHTVKYNNHELDDLKIPRLRKLSQG